MFSLSDLKIGARLIWGFGIVLACALALLVLGLWRMSELQATSERMVNNNVASLTGAVEMREMGWVALLTLRRIAIPTDSRELELASKKLDATLAAYADAEKQLGTILVDEKNKAVFDATVVQRQALAPVITKVRAQVSEGDYFNAASSLQGDFLPLHEKWMLSLGELAKLQQEEMNATHVASQEKYASTRNWMIVVGLATTLFCAFFGWKITGTVTQPMQRAVSIANAIASGNLTERIESTGQDEAGQLLDALGVMQANLIAMLKQIQSGSETISDAAMQIAEGNADLSHRTESQASSLQQTTATMESLTDAVQKNAAHTEQANALTQAATRSAIQGGEVVGRAVETMGLVKASSNRMSDIIAVIDGIAFQTNILALNAAVEAARAGEMGRGFAVVASEVRNLAQRSATAAKEIKQLIVDSMQTVDTGSALVNQAGASMEQIVKSVQQVATIMDELMAANLEQRSGIGEVNTAIAQIDKFTQNNATLVDQAAAAAESMSEQTMMLNQAVAVFKLDGTDDARSGNVKLLASTV
jgi:methyl-accepting chemotaxis protein